jgi:Spx/MgsR family transcriptional regulator
MTAASDPLAAPGQPRPVQAVLYGISNCDQVRKARLWLSEAGVYYQFHDFRLAGLASDRLDVWLQRLPWDALLNRRGTTWRSLDPARRDQVTDARSAAQLMLEDLRLIKRPVLESGNDLLIGFSASRYQSMFGRTDS